MKAIETGEKEKKKLREEIVQISKTNSGEFSCEEGMKKHHGANLVPFNIKLVYNLRWRKNLIKPQITAPYCLRDTLNLLKCADSNTVTKLKK